MTVRIPGPAGRLSAAATAALLLAACSLETALPTADEPSPTASATALGAEPPDPRAEALRVEIDALRRTIEAARAALVTAQAGPDDEADTAAEAAVALLVADAPLDEQEDPDPDAIPPLFPGPATSRSETIDYGDVFTQTLTAARGAGPAGAPLLEVFGATIAGDLGVWQRDAAGMLDAIQDAARSTDDVAAAETDVAELPGEGPKALAWALLADAARDDERRAAFAERGIAHLDLILAAIDDLAVTDAPADGA
jgi:hypothetical protein